MYNTLIPTPFTQSSNNLSNNDDDITVVMSNCGDKSDAATSSTMDSYQDEICTSQPKQWNNNYYNILEEPHQDMINTCMDEAPWIKIPNNVGISDAWAMGAFVVPGAPVINVRPTKNPLKITLLHGGIIESTHECNLDIPCPPRGHDIGTHSPRTSMC